MRYKMLISDLDETLLNDNGTINEKNIKAIKEAVQMGFKFVPNTGRSFNSVQGILTELGLKNKADQYVISYNGGAIIENLNNEVLIARAMDLNLANLIFKAGLQSDELTDVHVYTLDKLFIFNISEADRLYMNERGVPFELLETPDLTFLVDEKPLMKIIFENSNRNIREKIMTDVLREVGVDQVEATYSSGRYVEFNPAGVDKGSAGNVLGAKLGIKPEEIISAGDNSNDIAMIKSAGVGVAVQNAIAPVKDVAQVVTDRTNNEGAIAEILEKFVLGDD
ncbi:HAD family phosphatase [Weissella coleopterorum]|uniref:HAD family phosphatase n=1 Tax=Weissella coleopterorum TaxID=2714949 RepID=A0A6G8B051_9LACO|nr:Cof-type HAD-IIB family hydrolase [Weissella coleopterorum]QIL50503.1 HAD family phosphatase [Weissella coleopterorum]